MGQVKHGWCKVKYTAGMHDSAHIAVQKRRWLAGDSGCAHKRTLLCMATQAVVQIST